MKLQRSAIVAIALSLVLSACAPGLGTTLDIDRFDAPTALTTSSKSGLQVQVGKLIDARARRAVARVGSRDIEPAQDVGNVVTAALQSEIKSMGAKLALFEAPILTGEVREWIVTVTPDFPTSALEAKASIRLQITDQTGRVPYSGVYTGSIEEQHPWLREEQIAHALSTAMTYAIREALGDEVLLREMGQR